MSIPAGSIPYIVYKFYRDYQFRLMEYKLKEKDINYKERELDLIGLIVGPLVQHNRYYKVFMQIEKSVEFLPF